jgi:hypothetical protein
MKRSPINTPLVAFRIYVFILVIVSAAFLPTSHTREAVFTPTPRSDIITAASVLLASLIGIPALLAFVLGLLEFYGKISPGQSDYIQMWANTILYVICFIAVVLGKTELLSWLDTYLNGFSPILAAILALLTAAYHSIIKTRQYMEHFRLLYPIRLNTRAR